jgi:hypothetical protein
VILRFGSLTRDNDVEPFLSDMCLEWLGCLYIFEMVEFSSVVREEVVTSGELGDLNVCAEGTECAE